MQTHLVINGRKIGAGAPVYIIAEMSANHRQSCAEAARIVAAAREAGADAVKVQTFTADTHTIDSDRECFRVGGGTLWDGRTLYDLYKEAAMPWEWQPRLKKIAERIGIHFFSSVVDATSVAFLKRHNMPAFKIASFELVDHELLRCAARTGMPIILSAGMATLEEIEEAVKVVQDAGGSQLALLKCTSAYPAKPEDMNLRTVCDMAERFGVPVGLSDHTLGIAVPVAGVALGACIVEKHITLSRAAGGPDAAFSLEPHEFKEMVAAIRSAEKALGRVTYEMTQGEAASRMFRRSLFVVEDVKEGESFTMHNVRSIRPGHGLPPKFIGDVLGRRAARSIQRGSPLDWSMVERP